jgi:N-sulfoglucosamine sulfohydrolase
MIFIHTTLMQKNCTITRILLTVILSVTQSLAPGQQLPSSIQRPNILWITCEDMSLHLSCFGEKLIRTPNLDALAADGIRYTNVHTVAGVCAPSRNGIITGMYPQSIGGNNMRNFQPGPGSDSIAGYGVPYSYSIVPPAYVKCFPELLRSNDYYCTNNPKEDYQFEAPVTVWDESSRKAHWKNRPDGKPFFAIFNLNVTHESQLWVRDSLPLEVDPASVEVPPYYPDNAITRRAIARQLSNVVEMDRQAGILIRELKEAGLYDNTIIFFYSDHGDGLPYVKREILQRGLHIPLIVKLPGQQRAGQTDKRLISAIDFGATALSLAGIPVPKHLHGRPFLGTQAVAPRKYIFAARDRMDDPVDRVRTAFDGRYQYVRNYMPEKPWYQPIAYRLRIPMMKNMLQLKEAGQLDSVTMRWFHTKPKEEFYDTQEDPYELHNLADNPAYRKKFIELKAAYNKWMQQTGDLHATPEPALLDSLWNHRKQAPVTAMPVLVKLQKGYRIQCATEGASIGYQIHKSDAGKMADTGWKVYRGDILPLHQGDTLVVRAQRIGYKANEIRFPQRTP